MEQLSEISAVGGNSGLRHFYNIGLSTFVFAFRIGVAQSYYSAGEFEEAVCVFFVAGAENKTVARGFLA